MASQPNIQKVYKSKTKKAKQTKNKKILEHYTNCTVTSITTGRKGEGQGEGGGGGMIIWCGDNIIHKESDEPR